MPIRRILMATVGPVAFASAMCVPVVSADAQTSVQIEVVGRFTAWVTGAVGVGSETEVIEHKVVDVTGQEIIRKIPGRLKYLDIMVERGITNNLDLANWREQIQAGAVEEARANIIVTVFDMRLAPMASWDGTACWPSRLENLLPDPASETGEVVEKMVIVCEHLERTQ